MSQKEHLKLTLNELYCRLHEVEAKAAYHKNMIIVCQSILEGIESMIRTTHGLIDRYDDTVPDGDPVPTERIEPTINVNVSQTGSPDGDE